MIKLTTPYISKKEYRNVKKVLKSGNLTEGVYAREFEKYISNYIGGSKTFVTSSATTGIQLALTALGIGHSDEVIIPDFSFPATANAVIAVGATPIVVDIDLSTFCIDTDLIEQKISTRTKAIMPVHAFGRCADMYEILRIAKKHDLLVIEDAACAIGSKIDNLHAGIFGDCGIFSFHPRKIITTGEGGAITTNDPKIADKITLLRSHGGSRNKFRFMEFTEAGFNYRMSDVNAAIGLAQILKIDSIIEKRRIVAEYYIDGLKNLPNIQFQTVPSNYLSTYQSFIVLLNDDTPRNEILDQLFALGIESTLGTYSISSQPYWENAYRKESDVPNSIRAFNQSISLPISALIKRNELDFVLENIHKVLEKY
jgi:perosamine synthetase